MSYKIELIQELLKYVDSYENKSEKANIREFALHLKEKVFEGGDSNGITRFDKENYLNYKKYREVEFSSLLTGLFRFAKHYLKKTFKKTTFKSIDEFGFIASLLKEETLLKNELINLHHLEISSGSEILKRLIKKNLIKEYQDTNDKRAKRISLTEKGKMEIISAFDEMHKVSQIIRGNITNEELDQAIVLLNKLTFFHDNIWNDDKNTSMIEIYKKYIKNK